jgi:hypothetical protein
MRTICYSLALALFAGGVLAQPSDYGGYSVDSPPPVQGESYQAAEALNAEVLARNRAAAAQEAANAAAARARQTEANMAYLAELERHEAKVRAQEAAAAREQAAYEERRRAHQAALETARREQIRYEQELADWQACASGVRARCRQ